MTSRGRVAAALAAVSAIALLSACDDKQSSSRASQVGTLNGNAGQQQVVYRNLDACLAQATDMSQVQACRDGYAQAMEKMAEAPRYDNQATCEDVYGPGNCVPRGSVVHDGGGGGFIPFMMGYMIGGGFGRSTAYYPVYVDRGGTAFAGGGRVVGNAAWSGGAPAAVHPSASSVVRGGFGATAMTRSIHTGGG